MSWTDKVNEALREADLASVRRETLAKSLGINGHPLRVRLLREGTGWNALLDAERRRRFEAALEANPRVCRHRLIQRTGLGRQGIANAIKKWTGKTLLQIRAERIAERAAQ